MARVQAALGMVVSSIETHGRIGQFLIQQPMAFAVPNVLILLVRSVIWFVVSAFLVAAGRRAPAYLRGDADIGSE